MKCSDIFSEEVIIQSSRKDTANLQ